MNLGGFAFNRTQSRDNILSKFKELAAFYKFLVQIWLLYDQHDFETSGQSFQRSGRRSERALPEIQL